MTAIPYRQPCDFADCRHLATVAVDAGGDDDYLCQNHAAGDDCPRGNGCGAAHAAWMDCP